MTQQDGNDNEGLRRALYEIPYGEMTILQSWLVPIFFTMLVFLMSLAHEFICNCQHPRVWNFGSVEDIPGSSIYSTNNIRETDQEPIQQMKPWPDARPLN